MADPLAFREPPPSADTLSRQAVADRATRVLRPAGALARFDAVAAWLAGWLRTDTPTVERPVLVLAAGDHGVAARGVSSYPSDVTRAMVDAIRAGAATSMVMAEEVGATVRLVDAGVGTPTGDIVTTAALRAGHYAELVELGRSTVDEIDCDLLMLGEMGIGNTTAAAAVSAALIGGDPAGWVGPGAGADEEVMARKVGAVTEAVARVGRRPPSEVLRELGGAEMAVLAGACVRARELSIPVLLDGFVVTAAVAAPGIASPGSLDHCLAATLSPEPGHIRLLEALGLAPFLDIEMRLGEGTGALAALPLVRLATRVVVDVATFEEWGLR